MGEENGKQAAPPEAVQAVIEPWMDYWVKQVEQNGEWMQMLMAGKPPPVDPVAARKEWLATLSKSVDAYLRTPAFLEAMRKNAETLSAAKTSAVLAQREWAREAGIPHIDDISGLYERLETAHDVVLDKLNAIEKRLGAIEKKVNAPASRSGDERIKPTKKKTTGKKT